MTEFNLFAETHLKCDECGGPLLKGSLEELSDENLDPEDDLPIDGRE
jgi:hypothetical protein